MMYLFISIAIVFSSFTTTPETDYRYMEVQLMNEHPFHIWMHDGNGIALPEYYDWEETANGIGIDVHLLTLTMYYAYLGIEILNPDLWEHTAIDIDY